MKRINKRVKRLDLIATIFDFIFIAIAGYAALYLFGVLGVPDELTLESLAAVIDAVYSISGITITSAQINRTLSLLIAYLVIFIPTFVSHLKRLLDKETIEVDEWSYRTQFLYAFMSLFTGNIISAVLRILAGRELLLIVKQYGIVKMFESLWHSTKRVYLSIIRSIKKLFKRIVKKLSRTPLTDEEKAEIEANKLSSQRDLDRVSRIDFIFKVVRLSLTYTFLTFMALFIFIPFYWMILTALKTNSELTTAITPRVFIGLSEMQWINFKIVLDRFDFWTYIVNTITVGVLSMIGTVLTTILAAFAFSRLEFKGREFVFSILLMTMMIPGELYTITNYITVSNLGWINQREALIFPFMTSVFYIFFLRQTFRQIPDSLYRAAQVDGCSDFKYLTRVMIPIAKPTLTTIIILSAIGAWDAYIWPQLVINDSSMQLISVALRNANFSISDRTIYSLQLAATALVTVPLLIIFFSLKKYIMAGVGRSGIKG